MNIFLCICIGIILISFLLNLINWNTEHYYSFPDFRLIKDEKLNGEIEYYIERYCPVHGWKAVCYIIEGEKLYDKSFYWPIYYNNYEEAKLMLEKIIKHETDNYLRNHSKKISVILESKIEKNNENK